MKPGTTTQTAPEIDVPRNKGPFQIVSQLDLQHHRRPLHAVTPRVSRRVLVFASSEKKQENNDEKN